MDSSQRRRGARLLAVLAGMLLTLAPAAARVPPPSLTTVEETVTETIPVGTTTETINDTDDPGTPTTPGGTSHAPEPATLVSALLGAGIMSLYAARRRRLAAA